MTDIIANTEPSELGVEVAGAIRELAARSIEGLPISSYIEGASPLSWSEIADGEWDQIGVLDDGEGADLRDLVEVAMAWGETLLPLPYVETVLARRHSEIAQGAAGPFTFALPLPTAPGDNAYVPFADHEGIRILVGAGTPDAALADVPEGSRDELGLSLRGREVLVVSSLSDDVAREIAVCLAAESVGAARRLLEMGVSYTKERVQFGKPVGSFQAVKHHLANALIAVELAESAIIWASRDEHASGRVVASAVDGCIRAAELVLQVHGGVGFTWELGLHYYLRHMLIVRELVEGLLLSPRNAEEASS